MLALLSMIVTMAMGLIGATGKLSTNRLVHFIADTYTVVIRGIPELVLLLLVFFGGTIILQNILSCFIPDSRIDINPFITGILTIGFIYGAFATEVFRGAFLAIPRGQIEAATAIGMNRLQVFWRIKLPQVWRFALPGLGNVWLVLLKATSLMSVVGVEELARKSQQMNGALKTPFTIYLTAALLYLGLTALSNLLLSYMERRANQGVRR